MCSRISEFVSLFYYFFIKKIFVSLQLNKMSYGIIKADTL